MKIQVTEEDIREGVPCDATQCPIARAVERATGKRCTASETEIYIDGVRYDPPESVSDFIEQFDDQDDYDEDGEELAKELVGPFEFELDVV